MSHTERPPADPPRIVRPRKPKSDYRPVIAISRDSIVVESMNDEVFPADDLGRILAKSPTSILAVQGFGSHLQHLQRLYKRDLQFNYRVTPLFRYSRPWDDGRRMEQGMITDAVCNFVGWKGREKGRDNRYHFPIDPLWFLSIGIDDIDDSDNVRLVKLYKWGKEVRDWCLKNGLTPKASSGGLAAQLLRDPRFYPEPRRKVPAGINNAVRFQLPGNYYRLRPGTVKDKPYRVIILDMENAHHALSRSIPFPDANTLYAYGDYSLSARIETTEGNANGNEGSRGSVSPRCWMPGDSDAGKRLLCRPGIFHVRITVPHIPSNFFPPPYMESSGSYDVYLYTNELQLVESLGGKVEQIYSAFCSEERETGLNNYARYAIEEIRENPEYKPWLKPVLHSTYGLLAARPVQFETGYYRAKGGTAVEYPMGNASIRATMKRNSRPVESRICNVIQRGMIEAAVRTEALRYARFLTETDGHTVLAVYADALFLEDTGRAVRLLEPPWRVKGEHKHVRFHSATHFTSPSISRLPGVPRTARERFLRVRALHAELPRNLRGKPPIHVGKR